MLLATKFESKDQARPEIVKAIGVRANLTADEVESKYLVDDIVQAVVRPSDFGGVWIPSLRYGRANEFWIAVQFRTVARAGL